MSNLETNLLEVLTHGAVWLLPALLAQTVWLSYGTFIDGFVKNVLAGPYGSYDNVW